MIVFVFLVTVLIAFLIQWYIQRRNFYKFADNIPSPKTFGLLGHAPHFLGKDEEGRLAMLHGLCLEQKTYTKLWLGPAIMWILANDPKTIQKILLSPVCLEKPFFYKFLRLDSGLISARCMFASRTLIYVVQFLLLLHIKEKKICVCVCENGIILSQMHRL